VIVALAKEYQQRGVSHRGRRRRRRPRRHRLPRHPDRAGRCRPCGRQHLRFFESRARWCSATPARR
jgi:hypothetical protein